MSEYRICSRCVMDTSDPNIEFNEAGICNHCRQAETLLLRNPYALSLEKKALALHDLVAKIKKRGKKKKYDCIIGLSGGVDSSYVAFLTKQWGLRPLAIHLDNGWNSELSVQNIENICKKLSFDLYTHVIDWEEFKDLQLSFLKASTPDSEIPSDHAIFSILYKMAHKYGIGYILGGTNLSSESILPRAWSQGHSDWKYIKSVQRMFGSAKLSTFPHRGFIQIMLDGFSINWVHILDYIEYDKELAKKIITSELGWRNYGRKHGESSYTKIFQEYILPTKFGYDKRRAHLSSLIVSGQLERENALLQLSEPLYGDIKQQEEDIAYLVNKFAINRVQFEDIMNLPQRTMHDYPNMEDSWYYKVARILYKIIKGNKK